MQLLGGPDDGSPNDKGNERKKEKKKKAQQLQGIEPTTSQSRGTDTIAPIQLLPKLFSLRPTIN